MPNQELERAIDNGFKRWLKRNNLVVNTKNEVVPAPPSERSRLEDIFRRLGRDARKLGRLESKRIKKKAKDDRELKLHIASQINNRLYDLSGFLMGVLNAPRVLIEGDSWVCYPIIQPLDISDALSRQFSVFLLGKAGDTIANMASDQQLNDLIEIMGRDDGNYQCLFLSGGGNDMLELGLKDMLVPDVQNGTKATDYLDETRVAHHMDTVFDAYDKITKEVWKNFPEMPIITHGYAVCCPGKGDGKYLRKVFEHNGVPSGKMERDIVGYLLNRFENGMQKRVKKDNDQREQHNRKGRLHFVRVRRRGQENKWLDDDNIWDDEIHLKSKYSKLYADHIAAAIREAIR